MVIETSIIYYVIAPFLRSVCTQWFPCDSLSSSQQILLNF